MDQGTGTAGTVETAGDDHLTPGAAAALLGVHRSTLGRYLAAGLVTAVTLPSRHRRYSRASIEAIRATATGGTR